MPPTSSESNLWVFIPNSWLYSAMILSHSEYRLKCLNSVRSSWFLLAESVAWRKKKSLLIGFSKYVQQSKLFFQDESVFRSLLFPKEALLMSNQTHFHSSFILVFSLNERVGNYLFLLCLRVEYLEQFALLQFVQSTACMSLGDPAGLQPERTYAEVNPARFYCRLKPGLRSGSVSRGCSCAEDGQSCSLSWNLSCKSANSFLRVIQRVLRGTWT